MSDLDGLELSPAQINVVLSDEKLYFKISDLRKAFPFNIDAETFRKTFRQLLFSKEIILNEEFVIQSRVGDCFVSEKGFHQLRLASSEPDKDE